MRILESFLKSFFFHGFLLDYIESKEIRKKKQKIVMVIINTLSVVIIVDVVVVVVNL